MSLDDEISLNDVLSQDKEQILEIKLPNGIGLSIEQVQALVSKENNTFLPQDDPTMMIVTILNAFLGENKKLQDGYVQALRKLFVDMSSDVNLEIKQTSQNVLGDVKEALKTVSITGLTEIHKEQTKQIVALRQHLYYACLFIGASTFFNIIALIWR